MTTYAQLVSDVAAYLHRSDLSTMTSRFCAIAEVKLNRELRLRQQETAVAMTTIDANKEIALPTDFAETKVLWADGYEETPLVARPLDAVIALETEGRPGAFAVTSAAWRFDGAGDVLGVYFALIPGLEASSTNWLSAMAYDVYLYGALEEAYRYVMNDAQADRYGARFAAGIDRLTTADQAARLSGPLVQVVR